MCKKLYFSVMPKNGVESMFDLYKNIQGLCEERSITVGKMAVDIGMSKSLLSNLKNGRTTTISTRTAQRIAEYLGVPVDRVLHGIENDQPATIGDGSDIDILLTKCTEEQREMIRKLVSLPPEKLSALLKLTEPFLSEE